MLQVTTTKRQYNLTTNRKTSSQNVKNSAQVSGYLVLYCTLYVLDNALLIVIQNAVCRDYMLLLHHVVIGIAASNTVAAKMSVLGGHTYCGTLLCALQLYDLSEDILSFLSSLQ